MDVLTVFHQLANAIVQAAGSDVYHEIRTQVVKYLSRFQSKSKLEQDLDATQRRVRANPKSRAFEIDLWAEEIARIAAISTEASLAVHELSRQVNYNVNQSNFQQSGNYSPNQNVNITINSGDSRVESDDDRQADQGNEAPDLPRPDKPTGSANFKAIGIIILCLIVGTILLFNSFSSGSANTAGQFPLRSDKWPAGATAAKIIAPVVQTLSSCASEPVLSPANCPQLISDSYSGVSDVHWSLHGNAGDGANIVYIDNQFQVAGNAVMDVSYNDAQGSEFSLQLVHYRAWVAWNGGSPSVTSITNFDNGTPPVINKHLPAVPWASLTGAVVDAFRQCASYREAPLPQQCPNDPSTGIYGDNASWQLNNNPVGNAHECFDATWGLIHITGSFYMTASYHVFLLGTQHGVEQGNYKAIVAVDGNKVNVLQIVDENNSTAC